MLVLAFYIISYFLRIFGLNFGCLYHQLPPLSWCKNAVSKTDNMCVIRTSCKQSVIITVWPITICICSFHAEVIDSSCLQSMNDSVCVWTKINYGGEARWYCANFQ